MRSLRFNIDARINGAYVVLGLLYGDGDFGKTLEISTRAGQDSDCNPSSAAGILGVMLGYERIPEKWKAGIPGLADTKFEFTQYSFNEIVASTLARAEKVIVAAGGEVTPDEVVIPVQAPKAAAARAVGPRRAGGAGGGRRAGVVVEGRLDGRDPKNDGSQLGTVKGAGARATRPRLAFEGTGVAIVGTMSAGGRPRRRLPRRGEGGRDRRLDPRADPRQRLLARDRPREREAHRPDRRSGRRRRALAGSPGAGREGDRLRPPAALASLAGGRSRRRSRSASRFRSPNDHVMVRT